MRRDTCRTEAHAASNSDEEARKSGQPFSRWNLSWERYCTVERKGWAVGHRFDETWHGRAMAFRDSPRLVFFRSKREETNEEGRNECCRGTRCRICVQYCRSPARKLVSSNGMDLHDFGLVCFGCTKPIMSPAHFHCFPCHVLGNGGCQTTPFSNAGRFFVSSPSSNPFTRSAVFCFHPQIQIL